MVDQSNSQPVVLIGGFGFVGRNILEQMQLSKPSQYRPLVIDDLSNACPGHEDLSLPSLADSYSSAAVADFLDNEAKGRRTFIFLAGETRVAESRERPIDFIHANIVEPSKFVMEHVSQGDSFILISTAGALYDGTFEIVADSPFCPKNFYGASKAAEEMLLEKLVELKGATYAVVRMTNVYGPFSERKKSAIHAFIRAAINGTEILVNGDGEQTRDFIFSGDVARGILNVVDAIHGEGDLRKVNLLGQGTSTSLNDIIAAIEVTANCKLNCQRVESAALVATEPRDVRVAHGEVVKTLGNTITPLPDGLEATYDYYMARRASL